MFKRISKFIFGIIVSVLIINIFYFFDDKILIKNRAERYYTESFSGRITEKLYSLKSNPMIVIETNQNDNKEVYFIKDSLFSILNINDSINKPPMCDAIIYITKDTQICQRYLYPKDFLKQKEKIQNDKYCDCGSFIDLN